MIERPRGYVPPPPPAARDVARTVRAVALDVLPRFARLARLPVGALPTSSSEPGLALVRAAFAPLLGRLGVRLEVRCAEFVPRDGGVVLMWNQESHLDHLVLPCAIPRPFFSLYNNEIARFPFYGAHMRATGHVHVDRNDEAQWRPAVARAAARVAGGECVLVSPEGTRSWDGRLLPMKRGAFILAAASGRPVSCVTVIGGHARLPRGSAVVRGGVVRVVFAQPIANDGDEGALAERVAATFERVKQENALG